MKMKKLHHSINDDKCHLSFRKISWFKYLYTIILIMMIINFITLVSADSSSSTQEKKGLFSQMNNWIARLRGKDNQQSTQSDESKKDSDKNKEESTTVRPQLYGPPPGMAALYPPFYGLTGHPGFGPAPASPFAAGLAAVPPSPLFHSPMTAMSSHQFAAHHHPPPPPPRHLLHGAPPSPFNPFLQPNSAPIFSPYAQPSHIIPMHNDFGDSFGSFGPAANIGNGLATFASEPSDPAESFIGANNPGPLFAAPGVGGDVGGGGGGPLNHPSHHHLHHHHHNPHTHHHHISPQAADQLSMNDHPSHQLHAPSSSSSSPSSGSANYDQYKK